MIGRSLWNSLRANCTCAERVAHPA
jgi:hypothetical protein